MTISGIEVAVPAARTVRIDADTVTVELADGRTISAPLAWYPRLSHATPPERKRWRLIGRGQGIHWDGIDEDISVENLIAGRSSGESQASFKKWLVGRVKRPALRIKRQRKTPRRA